MNEMTELAKGIHDLIKNDKEYMTVSYNGIKKRMEVLVRPERFCEIAKDEQVTFKKAGEPNLINYRAVFIDEGVAYIAWFSSWDIKKYAKKLSKVTASL